MQDITEIASSPLFDGIRIDNLNVIPGCIGYHIGFCKNGEIIALEEEHIQHIGNLMSGAVDIWDFSPVQFR